MQEVMQANARKCKKMQAMQAMQEAMQANKQTTFRMWSGAAAKKQSSFMREKSDF